jgi:hypothetical protein
MWCLADAGVGAGVSAKQDPCVEYVSADLDTGDDVRASAALAG